MIRDREISLAVRRTLIMSSVATAGVTSMPAQAQAQDQPSEQPLTTVTVTGSRIRRVDVNQIPLSIIERVEILKEGAGAVYGSDAIAGVVNFITKKDVNGVQFNGEYGRTSASDGAHQLYSVLWGTHTDKFSFMLSGNYFKQDAVLEGR